MNLKQFYKYVFVFLVSLSVITGCGGGSTSESQKETLVEEVGALVKTPVTQEDLTITQELMSDRAESNLKVATWVPEMESLTVSSKIKGSATYSPTIKVLSQKMITSGDSTDGWMVYDNSPAGASIESVNDAQKGNVLKFLGDGLNNGYVVGYSFSKGSSWNDTINKSIKWSMKYDEDFIIYVRVTTTDGYRYLYYTNNNRSYGEVDYDKPHYIHNGLGATANDGSWRTFTRDLSADLKRHQPDNELISVDGFFVRGSGYIDDVELFSTDSAQTNTVMYEDAQDGQTSRWGVYTHSYAGSIENIVDEVKSSRVIALAGEGTKTGYILGAWEKEEGWKNTTNSKISWEMNYCQNYVVYISVETEQGHRFMTYSPLSEQTFATTPDYGSGVKVYGDYTYVHLGLNPNTTTCSWQTVSRDLEADLKRFEPNNSLTSVNAFLVRGSGMLDNIQMFDEEGIIVLEPEGTPESSTVEPTGNTVPVATAQSVTAVENNENMIHLAGTDADGDVLTYSIVTQPEHGSVLLSGNLVNYISLAGYVGADSFTYRVNDGVADSAPATVSIMVGDVVKPNVAPVAIKQVVTVKEDTTDNVITLAGTDSDGDSLTYVIVKQPTHGTVTLSGNIAKYTPTANYFGVDSFTFKVNDGKVDSAPATVAITVTNVPEKIDAPILKDVADQTLNVGVAIKPVVFENSGGAVSSCSVTPNLPAGLSLTKEGATCQIAGTPTVAQTVSDYVVTGTNVSGESSATVNMMVVVLERFLVIAKTNSNDDAELEKSIDGKRYTFRVYTNATPDAEISQDAMVIYVKVNDEVVTVSLNSSYPANAKFQMRVFDESGKELGSSAVVNYDADSMDAGLIDIPVVKENVAPVATPTIVTVNEDTTDNVITLSGTDSDGDSLTYSIVKQPTHGTVTLSGNIAKYTPTANYFGVDSFTFKVNDGKVDSAPATVAITVTDVAEPNVAPVAIKQVVTVKEDTTDNVITLAGTDSDGDSLTYSIVKQPIHGTVTLSGNIAKYTPTANYFGVDSFTFKVNDGKVDSAPAAVAITVTDVAEPNVAPVATPQSVTVAEDTTDNVITLVGTDSDGDSLTYSIVKQPTHGTVILAGNVAKYTPTANYAGTDSFTFKVNDGKVNSAPATVAITVTDVAEPNVAPVATPQSATVNEDTTDNVITLIGTDSDGDSLTYSIVKQPTHGTVTLAGNIAKYTPTANYAGADSFTFKVNDGKVDSAPATVAITVTDVAEPNVAPVATPTTVSVKEDTTDNVITLNGTDSDGDSLTYSIVKQPSHGAVTLSGNIAKYTPTANYFGVDSFSFKVNDGKVDSAPATVAITVTDVAEPNVAPVATPQSVSVNEDTTDNVITLVGTDSDGDTLTYSIVKQPTHGTVTLSGNIVKYTPTANYFGADSFTFKVNDGKIDSAPATVAITVTDVPEKVDAPVLKDMADQTFNVGVTIEPIVLENSGGAVSSCSVTPNLPAGLSVSKEGATCQIAGTPTVAQTVSDYVVTGTNESGESSATVNITVVGLERLSVIAKNTGNQDAELKQDIDGVTYTFKVYTDSTPDAETSQDSIVIYVKVKGEYIVISLNSTYPSNAKFQMRVFDANGKEVASSAVMDYDATAIDAGVIDI